MRTIPELRIRADEHPSRRGQNCVTFSDESNLQRTRTKPPPPPIDDVRRAGGANSAALVVTSTFDRLAGLRDKLIGMGEHAMAEGVTREMNEHAIHDAAATHYSPDSQTPSAAMPTANNDDLHHQWAASSWPLVSVSAARGCQSAAPSQTIILYGNPIVVAAQPHSGCM